MTQLYEYGFIYDHRDGDDRLYVSPAATDGRPKLNAQEGGVAGAARGARGRACRACRCAKPLTKPHTILFGDTWKDTNRNRVRLRAMQ